MRVGATRAAQAQARVRAAHGTHRRPRGHPAAKAPRVRHQRNGQHAARPLSARCGWFASRVMRIGRSSARQRMPTPTRPGPAG